VKEELKEQNQIKVEKKQTKLEKNINENELQLKELDEEKDLD